MPDSSNELQIEAGDRLRLRAGEVLVILLFWAFLAALTVTGRLLDPRTAERPEITSALISVALTEYSIWAALSLCIFWLVTRLSRNGENQTVRVALMLALGFVLAIAVDNILLRARIQLLPPPPDRMSRGAGLGSILRFEFLDDLLVYLAILAAAYARTYFLQFQTRLAETEKLRAESALLQARLAEAQLAVLRTQLNPHFLFNTLNAISSLAERDPRGVRRMIARLSDLLRHTLEQPNEQEVPLEQELELLGRYLDIMEVRFQGRLEVTRHIDEDVRNALVPNLILQPLVENAFKHGIGAIEEVGRIEIGAHRSGDSLILSVRDNGPGPLVSTNGDGLGLRNTNARLAQLYGERQRFALRPFPGGGTIAEVALPYHVAS